MNRIAIHTDDLTRDFKTVRAVDALSLDVPPGILFGFLGPNGSGKTTTIRLLLGLLEPTAGKAEVLGFDTRTRADDIRARVGALLEHPGLYERLSAEDNLEFYGRAWRLPASERGARIKELLSNVGLWERRKEPVGTWSRGMKQKLAVARALLHRPPLIFLDEPTAGLDPVAAAELRQDLAQFGGAAGRHRLPHHAQPDRGREAVRAGGRDPQGQIDCGRPPRRTARQDRRAARRDHGQRLW
jgi:ABC-2 type transport system ATP-binding protein